MGAGGALLLAPPWLQAAADVVDPRVAQVMSRTIGIDMHNHVYPAGTEPHPQHGPPRQPEAPPQAPDLSLAEELKRSGLTAVCASFVLDFAPNDKPGDARDNFLRWLAAIDAQLEKGHIRRALNLKDLQAAHNHAQPTIVQTVEGSQFIEGIWTAWKKCTNSVCGTCNCFTSETIRCRRWATPTPPPRTLAV